MGANSSQVPDLSAELRARNIGRLGTEAFDVLVVGGGINGAGIARDAAMRGLSVALVEKGDFASGTSSKSSKLVHGGLRYLERYHFRLVRKACRERDRLRKLAPHLVKPLPFLFPVYRGDPVGLLRLELGMLTYDVLSAFRNIRLHRVLKPSNVTTREPELRREGLRGACLYYDCWTDDARLTLETIIGAHEEGAVVANYVEVRRLLKDGSSVVGAQVIDRRSGATVEVKASVVVNATGPWLDELRKLGDPKAASVLRATKGVHILVPRQRIGNRHAVVVRSPRDRRVLFIIPWRDVTLIGTTDTDFVGSPDEVRPEREDVDYLLEAANAYYPAAGLSAEDVVSAYAGLRPLIADNDGRSPSSVSREEEILDDGCGLISLGGGKLTTYRLVSRDVVNKVVARLRKGSPKSATGGKALPGGRRSPEDLAESIRREGMGGGVDNEVLDHIIGRYGSRVDRICQLLRDDPALGKPLVAGQPDLAAEAVLANRAEMAVTVDDILKRRTHLSLVAPDDQASVSERISALLPNER